MTKSDDLADIITRNMNKNKVTQSAGEDQSHYQDQDIDVSALNVPNLLLFYSQMNRQTWT
jgi:hypothetical protein